MMRFLSGSVMRNTYKVGLMGGVPAAYVRAWGLTRDGHAIGWEYAENVGECGFHGRDPYPLIHGSFPNGGGQEAAHFRGEGGAVG